jgi:hypothetical protein
MVSAESRRLRAEIAARSRHNPNDPALPTARRDYRASRFADHIRRLVDQAPPLTAEQRGKLTAVLRSVLTDRETETVP